MDSFNAIHKRLVTLRPALAAAVIAVAALGHPAAVRAQGSGDSAPGADLGPGAGSDAGSGSGSVAAPEAAPTPIPDAQSRLRELLDELQNPESPEWQRAQSDLQREWSRSGSPAMDLLLQRGRAALEAGDTEAAIEHLTALTDHAPDFAEGWNARATAYFTAGAFGPSLADIEHVLRLNPQHYGALAGLGLILAQLDYAEAAAEAFRASLKANPHQADVREQLDRIERSSEGTEL
ncbi:tetratricopeptide repeat protein [Frigidibacter sp. MR17.24]|uniref:tetratricopeptide repeat protein n=1 Tax=Frigidibacter sp. MR17.24 TaxID=3127345 RepID=UPI00301312F3